MFRTVPVAWCCVILCAAAALSQMPPLDATRPIAALDSVFIEELTWLEVRDALKAGKTTVIIPTGGVEQNGPYLATGKHNYVLRATSEAIARKLGDALVAPIVPFVPEGDIDPPTGHMKYPGTISLTENTYRLLLTDICASLKTHGFEHIVMIGDSAGNQQGMKAIAGKLNAKWAGGKTRVYFIPGHRAKERGPPRRLRCHRHHDDRGPDDRSHETAYRGRQVSHQRRRAGPRRKDHRIGPKDR
jgi:hypothetical protein